jgi:hypothetical protein
MELGGDATTAALPPRAAPQAPSLAESERPNYGRRRGRWGEAVGGRLWRPARALIVPRAGGPQRLARCNAHPTSMNALVTPGWVGRLGDGGVGGGVPSDNSRARSLADGKNGDGDFR